MSQDFDQDGFRIERRVLTPSSLSELSAELDRHFGNEAGAVAVRRGEAAYALRNVLGSSSRVMGILRQTMLPDLLRRFTTERLYAVRGLLFDKPFRANWFVPYHQDRTVALRETRRIQPGFANWTVKAGVPHARPPSRFLTNMLTARIHLDETDEHNGALRVIPGSHREGLLRPDQVPAYVARGETICTAGAGDVLFMRPLLLHSSRATTTERGRRILHIEFSPDELPAPIEWMWRVEM